MKKGSFKQKKGDWHKKNRPFVFEYFKGVCQVCQKPISQKWDIHHLQYNYKGKLYDTDALELIENNIIILICRPCHNEVHTAKDPNNPIHNQFTLQNRFNCEVCGRNERGMLDRKKGMNLEKLMCRICFLEYKSEKKGAIQTKLF